MRKTLNKVLLRRLARKLRRLRHEEHYNQGRWAETTACGTAACIAGHALIETGYRFVKETGGDPVTLCRRAPSGKAHAIEDKAQEVLGLTDTAAYHLFGSDPVYYWPGAFAERWEAAREGRSTERKSRIAADLLDAIADTNGKILA